MPRAARIEINRGSRRADFSWLPALAKIVNSRFKLKQDISLALVSPALMKRLNRVYRAKDQVTDVLSFNIDNDLVLGEVIICPEQASRQARSRRVSYQSELKLLTVHGILHLLGYDHERSATAARRQLRLEHQILAE